MTDPVREYQQAVREYEKERELAGRMLKLIGKVHDNLQYHLEAFMFHSFSLPTASRDSYRMGPDSRVDMAAWPDASSLKERLVKWHAAFQALRNAWENVPAADRVGLSTPPQEMRTN